MFVLIILVFIQETKVLVDFEIFIKKMKKLFIYNNFILLRNKDIFLFSFYLIL
ncbi:protein of unknown function [Tenacibaculum jejuense]|uniref:Uncharacterized protein n=1 Tax=Tenacibaculum jejuense TaxID=584609 RepID=A0A238U7H9_9FLAO|nr:protein of unknown function [Tenacibaculum jejuense]